LDGQKHRQTKVRKNEVEENADRKEVDTGKNTNIDRQIRAKTE
jgi:hypothetical protein